MTSFFGHFGKEKSQFQFDLLIHEVTQVPQIPNKPELFVSCERGSRRFRTHEAVPTNGSLRYFQVLSFVSTLYKDNGSLSYKKKEFRVQLKTFKKVYFSKDVNLAAFASTGIRHATVEVALEPYMQRTFMTKQLEPSKDAPQLKVTVRCRWVNNLTTDANGYTNCSSDTVASREMSMSHEYSRNMSASYRSRVSGFSVSHNSPGYAPDTSGPHALQTAETQLDGPMQDFKQLQELHRTISHASREEEATANIGFMDKIMIQNLGLKQSNREVKQPLATTTTTTTTTTKKELEARVAATTPAAEPNDVPESKEEKADSFVASVNDGLPALPFAHSSTEVLPETAPICIIPVTVRNTLTELLEETEMDPDNTLPDDTYDRVVNLLESLNTLRGEVHQQDNNSSTTATTTATPSSLKFSRPNMQRASTGLLLSDDLKGEKKSSRNRGLSDVQGMAEAHKSGGGKIIFLDFADFSEVQLLETQGQFATVYGAKAVKLGLEIVVKVPKQKPGKDEWNELFSYLQLPPHPHVLPLIGVCRNFQDLKFNAFCLVTKRQRELKSELNRLFRYPIVEQPSAAISMVPATAESRLLWKLHQAAKLGRDMAEGLAHLHQHGFIHRDVALRNFLYSSTANEVLICDFGLSRHVEEATESYYQINDQSQFPVRWMPPEALLTSKFTRFGDIWMFGVALWEVWTQGQYKPFKEETTFAQVLMKICQDSGTKLQLPELSVTTPNHTARVSTHLQALQVLIDACLNKTVENRPTLRSCIERLETIQNQAYDELFMN